MFYSAHIQNVSQQDIAKSIVHQLGVQTNNCLTIIDPPMLKKPIYGTTFFVSPMRDNWISLYGGTDRFFEHVFRYEKYSGVILGAVDVGGDQVDSYATVVDEYWQYMVFRDGMMIGLFVYQPENFFEYWSKENICDVAVPYIESISNIKLRKGQRPIDFVRENYRIFTDIPDAILPFIKQTVTPECLTLFHKYRPYYALLNMPQVFNIPFVGLDYSDNALMEFFVQIENKDNENKELLYREFVYISFTCPIKLQETLKTYPDLFYWT